MRCYRELSTLKTYEERFQYLKLDGKVGRETFGIDRYLNQLFYRSGIWLRIRDKVILRDNACDLGIDGMDIKDRIIIHHMNPISVDDLLRKDESVINPDFLICVSKNTHNLIHYGCEKVPINVFKEREKYDTCPWKS